MKKPMLTLHLGYSGMILLIILLVGVFQPDLLRFPSGSIPITVNLGNKQELTINVTNKTLAMNNLFQQIKNDESTRHLLPGFLREHGFYQLSDPEIVNAIATLGYEGEVSKGLRDLAASHKGPFGKERAAGGKGQGTEGGPVVVSDEKEQVSGDKEQKTDGGPGVTSDDKEQRATGGKGQETEGVPAVASDEKAQGAADDKEQKTEGEPGITSDDKEQRTAGGKGQGTEGGPAVTSDDKEQRAEVDLSVPAGNHIRPGKAASCRDNRFFRRHVTISSKKHRERFVKVEVTGSFDCPPAHPYLTNLIQLSYADMKELIRSSPLQHLEKGFAERTIAAK